jgi:NAD(P)-dependent dehydrogenase (short-subunit alcohol dehydrogenase family)
MQPGRPSFRAATTENTIHGTNPRKMAAFCTTASRGHELRALSEATVQTHVPRSITAFQPLPGTASYAVSKAFVQSFSETVHTELAGTGITLTTRAGDRPGDGRVRE